MSRSVRHSLEEAGRRPVAPPDPSFAEDLEARLLAVAASAPAAPEPPPDRSRSGSRLRPALLALAASAAVVVLVLATLVTRPAPSVELVAPTNVEVALEDGTTLEDPGGLLLPEGAIITVGPGGSARVGDSLLVAGDIAVVHDGKLEIRHGPAIGAVTEPPVTATPRQAAPTDGTAPTSSPRPTVTAGPIKMPPPEPTAVSAPQPTARPDPTNPPATLAEPTPEPTPVVRRPRIRVRLIDGRRLAITWTPTFGADRYVLVATASRSGPAADPVYPGSRILGEFAVPPDPRLRYRVPLGVIEVRLRVVALRADGSVLRRSRVVTIAIPPAGDTGASTPDPSATPTPAPPDTPTPTPGP